MTSQLSRTDVLMTFFILFFICLELGSIQGMVFSAIYWLINFCIVITGGCDEK